MARAEMNSTEPAPPPADWLVRISESLADFSPDIVAALGGELNKRLGSDYFLIRAGDPVAMHGSGAAAFVRWNLPVEHAWPCNPAKMDGFVEKAAQTIFRKFGPRNPQAVFIGQLDPGPAHRYFKTLASNLRGRTLQLFPPAVAAVRDVEVQDPAAATLFCLVGKEGLFCGMQSPRDCGGFYPGGTKYVSRTAPDTISRAGAKVAEALHYLLLYRPVPRVGSHWLELGASPGGMTSELLARKYEVTAIDRAPLDRRLDGQKGLHSALLDVAAFQPSQRMRYDAMLCDMNGDAREAIRQVGRLASSLKPGAPVIFTLKSPGVSTFQEMLELGRDVIRIAAGAGLRLLARTHLSSNRHELTLFFVADSPP